MKNQTKLFSLGIILIVLLSACGNGSNVGNENEDIALEDLPPVIQELIAQSEVLPDFPLISQLSVSPSVVGPGDAVTLSGNPNLYGDVIITHASETDSLDFSSGLGSYTTPADAPDGVYTVSLENDEGATAIGTFRVASAPGIWLSTGGRYVGAEEFIKVSVTAYQVPLEMFAVFQLGLLVEEDIPEDGLEFEAPDPFVFDGPTAYLVPTPSGELRLGGLPGVPLSEIVDQTFLLPGKFANRIQVSALNAEIAQLLADGDYEALDAFDEGESPEGFQILSNIVSIQQCSQPGEVSGNLGGPGTVRAISLDGELITRSVSTENGSFTIQLPAGKAMIEGWREDGSGITYFPRQAVEVPCGAGVEVSLAAVSSPHLASLNLDPFYTIDSQAGGGGEICENIFINHPVDSSIEYEDADQLISAWAAQIDGGLDRASVASYFDNIELLKQAAQEQFEGGDGQDQMDTASENLGGNILVGSVINKFVDGRWFASVKAYDVSTGMGTPFARVTISGTSLASLRTLPSSFIEKIKKAGICAKIVPEEKIIGPGEEVNLVIEMTDLNGEAHDEVKIKLSSKSPACGDLEWTEKSITALSVTNKYTANDKLSCTDTLEFVGETEGPQGLIGSLAEDATAKIIKADLWHFNMTLVMNDPESGGLIDFVWDADFYIKDEGDVIQTVRRPEAPDATIGKFNSQNTVCRVYENGVLTFQSEHLNPHANWDIELGGSMKVLDNGFADIKIIPVGTSWNFSMIPLPDECYTDLFGDFLILFLKMFSLQPQTFVVGGVYDFGGMTDGPLTINFPLGAPFSDFVVTITKVPTLVNQP